MLKIAGWPGRYEVTSRGTEAKIGDDLRVGPLRYIRLKVHGYQQGTGMRKLKHLAGDRSMEVFGLFCKFLEISGDLPRHLRGQLLNENDKPATIKELAFIFDVPIAQIEHALKILTDEKLGWLIQDNSIDTQPNTYSRLPETPGNLQETPDIDDVHFRRPIQEQPESQDTSGDPDLIEVLDAWAAKFHIVRERILAKDRTSWVKAVPFHGKQWCLDCIRDGDSVHAGVNIVNKEKAENDITPQQRQHRATLAEIERHDAEQRKARAQ